LQSWWGEVNGLADSDHQHGGSPAPEDGVVLTPAQQKSRRNRSLALALVLAALVLIFYIVTLVKGPGVLHRPI